MMARTVNVARMMTGNLREFLTDARGYRELTFDERHLFWKKVQSWAFLALMPAFLVLGAISRVLERRSLDAGARRPCQKA